MCGIAGIVKKKSNSLVTNMYLQAVGAMVEEQTHRGPNDSGIWTDKRNAVLGHNRLSIMDLSDLGHQPMKDAKSGNVIVYNGEIYNYRQIRKDLMAEGVHFESDTDTEVILKGYFQWGIAELVKMLNGIFAFAIWDAQEHALVLVRDHMGVKPLYVYESEEEVFFASEVRALLKAGISPVLSNKGLISYLEYGAVQEPFTLIKGVRSIEPATYYIYTKDGRCKRKKYWNYAFANETDSKDEVISRVSDILDDTLKGQMLSDVPLGAFLSGGIDSSAIVSIMRRNNPNADIKTFSITFNDSRYDEKEYAHLVACCNKTEHTELMLTGAYLRDNVRKAISDMDQPTVDGLNTWFVSKLVKEAGLTVALSGVGGDEVFAGYDNFRKSRQIVKFHNAMQKVPDFAGRFIDRIACNEKYRKMAQTIYCHNNPYFVSRRILSDGQIRRILSKDYKYDDSWFEESYGRVERLSQNFEDGISQISFLEQRSYMLSTLLRDTDQMGMAHSLEIRVPLLDYRLVEYVTAIKEEIKVDTTTAKSLLVEATRSGIPSECIYRKKQGFVFPFEEIFKDEMRNELESFALGSDLVGLFDKKEVSKVWRAFINEKVSWSRIWSLYVLNSWLKMWNVSWE